MQSMDSQDLLSVTISFFIDDEDKNESRAPAAVVFIWKLLVKTNGEVDFIYILQSNRVVDSLEVLIILIG